LDINHDASNVIIKAIISLAKALELKVIAEGTENEEQLKFLETNDCDYVQGYYLCRPLPPQELVDFIKKYENEHHFL
jgi:EAL domain-containing protein (putative c-di-GMP-specific phosphodiesterase class I)